VASRTRSGADLCAPTRLAASAPKPTRREAKRSDRPRAEARGIVAWFSLLDVLPVGSTKLHRDSRKAGEPHFASSALGRGEAWATPEDSRTRDVKDDGNFL